MKPPPESRRRHPRYPIDGLYVSLDAPADDRETPISLLNISVSGAAIASPQALGAIDDSIVVGLRMSPEESPVKVPCRICYLIGEGEPVGTAPAWLHGARFHAVNWYARVFVLRYVYLRAHGAEP